MFWYDCSCAGTLGAGTERRRRYKRVHGACRTANSKCDSMPSRSAVRILVDASCTLVGTGTK